MLLVAIVVVCSWLASTFLGAIDWASVGEALSRLAAWQVVVLVLVLLLRQTLNAYPLALFIEDFAISLGGLKYEITSRLKRDPMTSARGPGG